MAPPALRPALSRTALLLGLAVVVGMPSFASAHLGLVPEAASGGAGSAPLSALPFDQADPLLRHTVHGLDTVRVETAPAPHSLAVGADENHEPTITYVCPEPDPIRLARGASAQDPVIYGCPLRIYDTTFAFGSPDIAVHPSDVTQVAFSSLHGGHTTDGATDRSRTGSTHTVFTSESQGLEWYDQPIMDSSAGTNNYGDYSSVVIDDRGQIIFGYLWTNSFDGKVHGGRIGLYKAASVEFGDVQDSYRDEYRINATNGDVLTRLDLVHLHLGSYQPVPVNNTSGDWDPGQDGDLAVYVPSNEERVMAVWLTESGDPANQSKRWQGWIDAAWSDTSSSNNWSRLPEDERIGPCKESSNPVAYRDDVYVACVVAKGYDHRRGARIGDVDIWKIDLESATTEFVDATPLDGGGHAWLASTSDGFMMLLQHVFHNESKLFEGHFAVGWYGRAWEEKPGDLGHYLHKILMNGYSLRDAYITGLVISDDTKVGLLVYHQWLNQTPAEAPMDFDPQKPPKLNDFTKTMVAINYCDGPIAAAQMDLGTGLDPYHYQQYQINPGGFNDVQDGLQFVRDPGGGEIVYFAVNDYGAVQYGGVVVEALETFCTVPPPPPPPPPILPQPLSVANAAGTFLSAGVGVVSAAAVGYLLTVKRRLPSWVTAQDK